MIHGFKYRFFLPPLSIFPSFSCSLGFFLPLFLILYLLSSLSFLVFAPGTASTVTLKAPTYLQVPFFSPPPFLLPFVRAAGGQHWEYFIVPKGAINSAFGPGIIVETDLAFDELLRAQFILMLPLLDLLSSPDGILLNTLVVYEVRQLIL